MERAHKKTMQFLIIPLSIILHVCQNEYTDPSRTTTGQLRSCYIARSVLLILFVLIDMYVHQLKSDHLA